MRPSWLLAAAAAIVLMALGTWALLLWERGEPFVHVASRPGPQRGDERVLIHSQLPLAAPGFRAAAEAGRPRAGPRLPATSPSTTLPALPAAQIGNEYEAQLTYCMHGDGRPAALADRRRRLLLHRLQLKEQTRMDRFPPPKPR